MPPDHMTPEQFCYWLQGFSELQSPSITAPTVEQWQMIREHLATVFNKVTPPMLTQPSTNWPAIPVDMRPVC